MRSITPVACPIGRATRNDFAGRSPSIACVGPVAPRRRAGLRLREADPNHEDEAPDDPKDADRLDGRTVAVTDEAEVPLSRDPDEERDWDGDGTDGQLDPRGGESDGKPAASFIERSHVVTILRGAAERNRLYELGPDVKPRILGGAGSSQDLATAADGVKVERPQRQRGRTTLTPARTGAASEDDPVPPGGARVVEGEVRLMSLWASSGEDSVGSETTAAQVI